MIVLKGLAFIVDFIISVSIGLVVSILGLVVILGYRIVLTIFYLIILPFVKENKDEKTLEQLKQLVKDEKYIKTSCFDLIMWRLPVQIWCDYCDLLYSIVDIINDLFDKRYDINWFWLVLKNIPTPCQADIDLALIYRLGNIFNFGWI